MYKILFIFFIIVSILYCSRNNDPLLSYSNEELMEFRKIAWNDLSDDEIETVIISKEEFRIQYATVSKENGNWYYMLDDNKKSTFALTNSSIDYHRAFSKYIACGKYD